MLTSWASRDCASLCWGVEKGGSACLLRPLGTTLFPLFLRPRCSKRGPRPPEGGQRPRAHLVRSLERRAWLCVLLLRCWNSPGSSLHNHAVVNASGDQRPRTTERAPSECGRSTAQSTLQFTGQWPTRRCWCCRARPGAVHSRRGESTGHEQVGHCVWVRRRLHLHRHSCHPEQLRRSARLLEVERRAPSLLLGDSPLSLSPRAMLYAREPLACRST